MAAVEFAVGSSLEDAWTTGEARVMYNNAGYVASCCAEWYKLTACNARGRAAAFQEKLAEGKFSVDLGFKPANLPPRAGEKPAWTRRQWRAALQELTQAPHHVVPEKRMVAALGDGDEEAGRGALPSPRCACLALGVACSVSPLLRRL